MRDKAKIDTEIAADIEAAYTRADAQPVPAMRMLAQLFLLESAFRRATSSDSLAELIISRLYRFAPYERALFWTCTPKGKGGKVGKLSHVTITDISEVHNSKKIFKWANKTATWLAASQWNNAVITPALLELVNRQKTWPASWPQNGLYVPLKRNDGAILGGLLLLRSEEWSHAMRVMLDQMGEAAAYTIQAMNMGLHTTPRARRRSWGKLAVFGALLCGLAIGFFVQIPAAVNLSAQIVVDDSARQPSKNLSVFSPSEQIDLSVSSHGALTLSKGDFLLGRHNDNVYRFEVAYITPFVRHLFAERRVRVRVVSAEAAPAGTKNPPTTASKPTLQLNLSSENTHLPLPTYLLHKAVLESVQNFLKPRS